MASRKRKHTTTTQSPTTQQSLVNRPCLCDGGTQCFETMQELNRLGVPNMGWICVPRRTERTTVAALLRKKKYRAACAHLGQAATETLRSTAFSPNTNHYYASTHLPPSVRRSVNRNHKGQLLWANVFVPRSDGLALGYQDSELLGKAAGAGVMTGAMPTDFVAAPNHLAAAVKRELEDARAKRAAATPVSGAGASAKRAKRAKRAKHAVLNQPPAVTTPTPPTRRPSRQARNATSVAQASPEVAGTALAAMTEELAKRTAENEALRKERAADKALISELQKRVSKLEATVQGYAARLHASGGLTRQNLLSPAWHADNPDAANHLFGFTTWKEVVLYIWALWPDVKPPIFDPHDDISNQPVTEFERALITKMRIRRATTEQVIAIAWDRTVSSISKYIKAWAPKWGEAGRHLSILDISKEFLTETMPMSYVEAGLTNVGAVPDGKDFMIDVWRKNALLTRACFSDKVHHAAVRCISWSTPAGLMFEHTDLFLARISEKRLVELWGPRLKKVPAGWVMLTDRGFANTARYYPNFNAQLTPKFLSGRLQFSSDEVSSDWRICQLRYTCEVAFSRVTNETGLKDVITRPFFSLLNAMHHWGHANANLKQPLQK